MNKYINLPNDSYLIYIYINKEIQIHKKNKPKYLTQKCKLFEQALQSRISERPMKHETRSIAIIVKTN